MRRGENAGGTMPKRIFNTQYFKDTRRELRAKSTPEEVLVWERIRNKKLGTRFKRQESIGHFIIDFYCPKSKLAIEIDGVQHQNNLEYDQERTWFLNSLGIKVLRFGNDEVNQDVDVVVKRIEEALRPHP